MKFEPWMAWGIAGVGAYLLLRAAKNAVSEAGGILGGVGDVLLGAPKAAESFEVPATVYAPQQPKRVGLFVRWINPAPGGTVDKRLWSRSYPAALEIENATKSTVAGLLEIRVEENAATGTDTVVTTAGPYTFAPNTKRVISLDLNTQAFAGSWATAFVRLGGKAAIGEAQTYFIQ